MGPRRASLRWALRLYGTLDSCRKTAVAGDYSRRKLAGQQPLERRKSPHSRLPPGSSRKFRPWGVPLWLSYHKEELAANK